MKRLLGHVLIGVPGSGKSTFAQQWIARSPEYIWLSTDRIRAELFGDAANQGDWEKIAIEFSKPDRAIVLILPDEVVRLLNFRRGQLNDQTG
ncbi:MAG: ATP-binding protein [Cyanobacteria bacterium CRU_2_1]|nr:ATP-binding protein [Cyanobacteria bacterium CRU_2_1]